jgi:hypothetical protein
VTACIFCSLVVYALMPDTRKTSRIDRDEAAMRLTAGRRSPQGAPAE